MCVTEHHDITVAVLRLIDDAGYAHIDAIIVSMGQKAAMLSDLHDDILRQRGEEVVVSLHEIALHAVTGILLDHALRALGITEVDEDIDHPDATQYILQVRVVPVGITYDEDGLKGADKSAFLPGLCPVFRRRATSRSILFQDILQQFAHRTKCLAPMRDRVLLLRCQFRRSPTILRKVEDRIISETMLPLRLMGDQALEDAFCVEDTSVCKCSADIAGEVCRAFIPLRIAKLMDDACIFHII